MGNLTNIRGKAGEFFCGKELMRPVANGDLLFDIARFDGKEPTADYIVFLINSAGERTGPFFFVQVKSTTKGRRKSGDYAYSFDRTRVQRAQALKTPFILCLVDLSTRRSGEIFIMGVDSNRITGIRSLPRKHDLAKSSVKITLFDEVTRIWTEQNSPRFNRLI